MDQLANLGLLGWLYAILFAASYATRLFALVDVLTRRSDAFPAAGKLTKLAWCAILGIGVLVGLPEAMSGVRYWNPIGLLNLAGLIAAMVYLVDVRPAVREIGKPGRNQGPYGSW